MPASPEWANLPKRKCDDCGKTYKPKQPMREGFRGFCSDNCRKSYHKHGGAYRKLRVEMERMITARMKDLEKRFREIVHEELRAIARENLGATQRMEDARREIADVRRAS